MCILQSTLVQATHHSPKCKSGHLLWKADEAESRTVPIHLCLSMQAKQLI